MSVSSPRNVTLTFDWVIDPIGLGPLTTPDVSSVERRVVLDDDGLELGETVEEAEAGHPHAHDVVHADRVLLLALLQVVVGQSGVVPAEGEKSYYQS